MLSIILVQIFIVAFFVIIGIPHKFGVVKFFTWGLAVIEFAVTVWMIYLSETGQSLEQFLYLNSISVVILGGAFGSFSLIMFIARMAKADDDDQVADDGYTKWVFGK